MKHFMKSYENFISSNKFLSYRQELLNASLLEYSTKKASLLKMKTLIEDGADVNYEKYSKTPLINATMQMFYSGVKLLIEKGADVNKANDKKETPLLVLFSLPNYTFSKYDNVKKITHLLIENGADISTKNLNGEDIFNLKPNMETEIEFYFPKQYEEYLLKKTANKYNIG